MKASIIIINYNDKQRVRRAINSALSQTWHDTEVIMVDDGSDNETREIYKDFEGRIKMVQLERDDANARTPSRARNAGLDVATGKFVSVLDSDNYFAMEYIESLIKLNADVAFCNWEIVGMRQYEVNIQDRWDFNTVDTPDGLLKNYLHHCQLDHQCLLIRREYLDKCGLYDERLPRSQDCDLIVRLVMGGGRWSFTPKRLFTFETHEEDQMKTVASIYGKTLWTLKNNINYTWLCGAMQSSPYLFQSVVSAVNDFINSDEWAEEYNNSNFKQFIEAHGKVLRGEQMEKVSGG